MPAIGALILAAGAATRMGQTKQLLLYRGTTFVEHAVQQAQQAGFHPVVVVLGANSELVQQAVQRTSAAWVVNHHWQTGMGSSLTAGLDHILQLAPDLDALAILLADQPRIEAAHLTKMGRVFEQTHAPILAASYAGTVGVPALFRNQLFPKLKELPPAAGARALLRGDSLQVHTFDLPEAASDIDTPEDLEALNRLPT